MNTENNKLIAEFMDWEIHPIMFQKMQKKGIKQGFRKLSDFVFIKDLAYHSDWNWLMQVVEKIESLGYRTLAENECFMITKSKLEPFDVRSKDDYSTIFSDNYEINHYGSTKLTNTYTSVVEFIKWYNLNKNQYE